MTIFIDQDNVLNKFIQNCVIYINRLYQFDIRFVENDCKDWDVFKQIFPFASKKFTDEMSERVFSAPGFWSTMKIMDDAAEIMQKLISDGHEVYIATMPWKTARNCITEKTSWVEENLPFFGTENMIFCPNKKFLIGDVILDDAPHIIENTPHCKYRIIYDYPYNQNVEASFRIKSWNEAYSVISNLER